MAIVDVKQLLITTLNTAFKDYPVFLQGSMAEDAVYPANFFTFWNNSTTDSAFYDNSETETIWNFDINFYSNNPSTVNTVLATAKTALKRAGFIIDGVGYDVISDEASHTGRGMNAFYIQKLK